MTTMSFVSKHTVQKARVLVDADPQCNATQALLNDEVIEQIYVDKQK